MEDRVARVLTSYAKDSGELIGEYPLRGIGLDRLRCLFDVPRENPMYDCWAVDHQQAAALQAFVSGPIDLDAFDFFVESHALSGTRVAAVCDGDPREMEDS